MSEQLHGLEPKLDKEAREPDNLSEKLVVWAGAYTILFIGFAHALICGEHFLVAPYLGVLFLLNCAGSILAAIGLAWGGYRSAWLLGIVIAGGALVGFVLSRTVGLPGYTEEIGRWFNIAALLTVGLDLLFLALAGLALTSLGRTTTRTVEQEREDLQPALVAQNLDRIEKEMAEVRQQAAPDLVDLKKHLEPAAVKERLRQGVLEYLRAFVAALRSAAGEVFGAEVRPLASVGLLILLAALVARRMASGGDEE